MPSPLRTALAAKSGVILVVLLAVALRITAAIMLPPQPHLPDAETYRAAARSIAETGRIGSDIVMPLYPVLIALAGSPLIQLAIDILLSALTALVAGALALELFRDRRAALVAALLVALYPLSIFYAVIGHTETLFTLLLMGAMLALYKGRYGLASAAFVLCILTRPAVELFAPVVIVWMSLAVHRAGIGRTCLRLACYAAIYVVLMAPWWLHNYDKYGQFVRLNLAGGPVLYTGNNPMNRSGGGILGVDVDFSGFEGIADPIEREAAMKKAAIDFIKEDPARFAALALRKVERLWRVIPYAPEYRWSITAVAAAISVLPGLIFGAITAIRCWRQFFLLSPIYGLFAFLTLVHAVSIGSIRYRYPLEPFLLVLAAPAVVWLMQAAMALLPGGARASDRHPGGASAGRRPG